MAEKYQIFFWCLVSFTLFTALAFFILATNANRLYFLGILNAVPLGVAAYASHGKLVVMRRQRSLRATWGKRDTKVRDLDRIEQAYDECTADESPPNALDDETWLDLNMDGLYTRIDRTLTTPGAVTLYRLLRCPETNGAILQKRNRITRLFQLDREAREAVQLELAALGKEKRANVTVLLWGERMPRSRLQFLFLPLALASGFSIVAPAIWGLPTLLFLTAPLFIINFLITHRVVRSRVYEHLGSMRYLGALVGVAKRIAIVDRPELADSAKALSSLTDATSRIVRKTRFLVPERSFSMELAEIVAEYISVFFLVEARAFYGFLDDLERHRNELRRLYEVVGELDALQSVASFRSSLPEYVEPELVEDGAILELCDGRHPLVEDPVSNSIRTEAGGIFVTGPNMAGKTTFLRTVAVNAVMAQSIYTCYASAYRASFFRIISSITHADELEEGVSYYLVEAERLLRIVKAAEGDVPCLCVIDEMLTGTNWAERKNASVAILDYLRQKKTVFIVSSHDVDLAHALQDRYENYHFTDHLDEDGLQFDYALREGTGSGQNAILLLERLGYPEEIVVQARKGLDELN